MPSLADITIVSVAYNSSDALQIMLRSVPAEVPVIVVDNGSEDLVNLRSLIAAFPNAQLVEAGENLGFGRANNLGANQVKTEFLLIQNPDTLLTTDTLSTFLLAATDHPKASAFNPKFVDESGRVRYKRHNKLLPKSRKMPRSMPDHPFEVCALVGASIFLRTSTFKKVEGFDPNIFLYFEDDDLSVRLENTCGPLMIIPDAIVTHARGRSSKGDENMSPFKQWHFGFSRVYACVKHRRPLARTAAIATALRKLLTPKAWMKPHDMKGRIWHLRGTLDAVMGRTATRDSGR